MTEAESIVPEASRRVKRIAVSRMFGVFDHSIELNMDARATIIVGANGVGKTRLLESVALVLNSRFKRLAENTFSKLVVEFDDKSVLSVVPVLRDVAHSRSDARLDAPITRSRRQRQPQSRVASWRLEMLQPSGTAERWDAPAVDIDSHRPRELPPWIRPLGPDRWLDERSERVYTTELLVSVYGVDEQKLKELSGDDEPVWFKSLRRETSVQLIETQRLVVTKPRERARFSSDDSTDVRFAVSDVAAELIERIRRANLQYTRRSSVLDRTYVDRFLTAVPSTSDVQALKARLEDISKRRTRLEGFALLGTEPDSATMRWTLELPQDKRLALELYTNDMARKLKELEPLAEQLEKFIQVMNRKLRNKRLVPDPEQGLYVVQDMTSVRLELQQLSSGEQHELVLLYNLIFRVGQNSLVLIDEPELSLHPIWQEQFIDDLLDIVGSRKFDVVLATHSPYIIGARSDLCVALSDSMQRVEPRAIASNHQ